MIRRLLHSASLIVACGLTAAAVHAQPPAAPPGQHGAVLPVSDHREVLPVPAIPGAVAAVNPLGPPVLPPGGCPPPCPAPVLFVRITGPVGTQATFFEPFPREFDTPVGVGLRPGYVYRFKLSGLERHPKLALYPTLQVIGTLAMPPPLQAASFPTPVIFTQDDINRAMAGTYFTKVIVLEDPETATPVQTQAERPLEWDAKNEREIMEEARAHGRPVLVVRFGDCQVPDEVLARATIPGTVLLPGDPLLGPPAAPPPLPWACVPLYDPILGPKPLTEECMHDGGDVGAKAGFGPDGELHGLDPSDTVAEYVDACGRRKIAISNRVCVCVPRFAVIRTELAPRSYANVQVPANTLKLQPPVLLRVKSPPLINEQVEQPEQVLTRKRPSVLKSAEGFIILEQTLHTGLVIGELGSQVVVGVCEQKCEKPVCPLVLTKCVDRKEAQIGDVVTFTLRYNNPGGKPIVNVVVSDSLTARLDYVPGSAKSDRDAVFTTQANEVGSQILRWQLSAPLQAGEIGVITFQAKIR
jgi:uncharacterized repeat protein (TIGR01451 family)